MKHNLLKNQARYYALGALALVIAFSAVAASDTEATRDKPSAPAGNVSFSGSYLSGVVAGATGDSKSAADYFEQALKRDPNNQLLIAQSFKYHLTSGQVAKAADLADRLDMSEEREPLADLLQIVAKVKRENWSEASKRIDQAGWEGFNAILLPLLNVWVEYGAGTMKGPAKLDEVAEDAKSFAPFVYYQLALVNDLAGHDDAALGYYKKLTENIDKMPFRVVQALGNFYERTGKKKQAKELYDAFRAANPENYLGGYLGDPAGAVALTTDDTKVPARIVSNASEGVAEIFFAMASILYGEDVAFDTMVHLRIALYLRPDFAPAQFMLGSVLEQLQDDPAAIAVYESLKPESPYFHKAQLRRAMVVSHKDTTKAIETLDAMIHANPEEFDVYATRGDVLRQASRFEEAAADYTRALSHVKQIENHHWPLLFARAISYERSGRWELAEKDLQEALNLEPGQPDMLNYLGYSWLIVGKNIKEAKAMIEQAIDARPNDAQIIDSMGWALYQLGQYNEAVSYLEQAVEMAPSEAVINDHLGDAYWRAGRKNEAKFQWRKALAFLPEEKIAQEIREKLKAGVLPPSTQTVSEKKPEEKPVAPVSVPE